MERLTNWLSNESTGRVKKRTLMDARATKLSLPELIVDDKAAVSQPREPLEVVDEPREPGRFQVMALLQANPLLSAHGGSQAKSWGLDRAIFYAWAKYCGSARRPAAGLKEAARRYSVRGAEVSESEIKWVEVSGEEAQMSPRGWFVVGGVEQRPEDFDKHVARKFEEAGELHSSI